MYALHARVAVRRWILKMVNHIDTTGTLFSHPRLVETYNMKMYMALYMCCRDTIVDNNVYYSETKAQKRVDRLNKDDIDSDWFVNTLTVRDKQVK